MAWIFALSVECRSKEDAQSVADHFDGHVVVTGDGTEYPCDAGVSESGGWWANCSPIGVSTYGISDETDQRIMTAVGFGLYEHLRTSPRFRYAIVGVEAEAFCDYDNLGSYLFEDDLYGGLVLSEDIWRRLATPGKVEPFAPGYVWRPFVRAH